MRRLSLLVLAAAVVSTGAPVAHATTICFQNVCVCTDCEYSLPDQYCVRVDIDGDGHFERVCV